MIGGAVDPAEVGPLSHHGPELLPFVDLIVGGGLPIAAAVWLSRWRSVRARLPGGGRRDQTSPLAAPEGGPIATR